MNEGRPTPEEMLARVAREDARARVGRFKIFFGAVPGVGKTYAMLEAAQAARRRGVDVVLGWVETHGRSETARLTEGFERIPPRELDHRGVVLREFDLDAALARAPALILVDELAHTNAPGSRHARRWQDVAELLEAGIDVVTTLNVQHVESLNDVVARITGITVRETVPDSVIDRADEIELVDLAPDDLLQRLAEGKVYVPSQAERASVGFFKKGNLIALRELALRRTADRVDAQGSEWKRDHGIEHGWRTQERVLVAVDASERSGDLIRAGRRMADSLHTTWIVVTVETPAFERLPDARRERVSEHLALAQRLGAETLVVRGDRPADLILNVARERNVSRIVVGRPSAPRWRTLLRGSLVDELVRHARDVDVLVTSGEVGDEPVRQLPAKSTPWSEYAWSLLPVACATIIVLATRAWFTQADQAMIYLLGVLVGSSRVSRLPASVSALLSIAAFDFFCVPPFYDFAVEDARYIASFVVMLVVAIAVSHRTVLLRELADAAHERERRTSALFELGRRLSFADEPKAIAAEAVRQVRAAFGCEAVLFLGGRESTLAKLAGDAEGSLTNERELAVARWTYEHGRAAGFGTDTLPGSKTWFLPLVGASGPIGVFGTALGALERDLSPSQRQVLETFVAQAALALERVLLRGEADAARLAVETERLRSTLLSTVSHDLRTPLASISGAAQVLLDDGERIGVDERRALLESVREESARLGRLVSNLLDMTRLESGALEARKEWCPLDEVVHAALGRVRPRTADRAVNVTLPDTVLQAAFDPLLIESVLENLLDNALKYSPAGSPLDLRVTRDDHDVLVEVEDRGRGIPVGEEERIFEKFHRAASEAAGVGLGLALAQAIVHAHGGTITAENRAGGGTRVAFRIPIGAPPHA